MADIFDTNNPQDTRTPILYNEWDRAKNYCIAFANSCEPGEVGFAIGPGGCGKTVLSKHLADTLYGGRNSFAPNRLPVIRVEADLADRGFFTTKSLMRALSDSVRDPFRATSEAVMNWNIDPDFKARLAVAVGGMNARDSEPNMRPAFINVARLRQLRLLIIDEANLLILSQRGRVPTDYLESLRRLADSIGCGVLLFGTVDMLSIMDYSGQLNRRTMHIHVDRMRCDSEESKASYLDFLTDLQGDLGITNDLLISNATEIFQYTYGIPGEIVGLVKRAHVHRLAHGQEQLSSDLLDMAAHLPALRRRMMKEADLIASVLAGETAARDVIRTVNAKRKRPKSKRRALGSEK